MNLGPRLHINIPLTDQTVYFPTQTGTNPPIEWTSANTYNRPSIPALSSIVDDQNSPLKCVLSVKPYKILFETNAGVPVYATILEIKTWTASKEIVNGVAKWHWYISEWAILNKKGTPLQQSYQFTYQLALDGFFVNTTDNPQSNTWAVYPEYEGFLMPWSINSYYANGYNHPGWVFENFLKGYPYTTPYDREQYAHDTGLSGPFFDNSDIKVWYRKTSTSYYSDNSLFQASGADIGSSTASNHVFMADWSNPGGITYPYATNDLFESDATLTAQGQLLMGMVNDTYTTDITNATLAGFALYGAAVPTIDIAQQTQAESLVLVFGNVGEISADVEQTTTSGVIQDLLDQETFVSLTDILPTAELGINIVNQTLDSEVNIDALMGLAWYGQSQMAGEGFLLSSSFVIRLDDYWLVRIAPESRTVKTAPENRYWPVEPETKTFNAPHEYKYYLVEPETRQYKITANRAQQIGPRTRRLEQ
jgi:hypothetical protein